MTFPVNVTTCILSIGSSLSFFGDSGSVSVVVTPVIGGGATYIVWDATGDPFVAAPKTFTSVVGSPVQVTVPHVDQPGFIGPSGDAVTFWAYNISVKATVNAKDISWVKNVQPVQGQGAIDVDKTPDGPIATTLYAPVPAVTSVNGETGAVVLDLGGGGGGDGTTTVEGITDAGAPGKALLHAADQAAARGAIGAGTSSLVLGVLPGTAAAGNDPRLADQRTPTNGSVNNAKVATGAAIDAAKIATSNDTTMAGDSPTAIPTEHATKTFVETRIAALDALVFQGLIDASTNPNYPAAVTGDNYRISVAGKTGGASGTAVEVGDWIICITDTAAGNQASVGANWGIVQVNADGIIIGPASAVADHLVAFNGTSARSAKDSGIPMASVVLTGDARLADARAAIAADWAALTVYVANQLAVQSGNLIRRIAGGTSRATYDATEQALWTSLASPINLATVPAGYTHTVVLASGSWPGSRPTARTDVYIIARSPTAVGAPTWLLTWDAWEES